jgi:hypothetical protein
MKRWWLAVALWLMTGWTSLLPVLTVLGGLVSVFLGRGSVE